MDHKFNLKFLFFQKINNLQLLNLFFQMCLGFSHDLLIYDWALLSEKTQRFQRNLCIPFLLVYLIEFSLGNHTLAKSFLHGI